MKVILSRKGLDSENGGIPSPIIETEDGDWKYFPIPIPRDKSDIKYSDLTLFDDYKVSDFLKDVPLKSKPSQTCHLDPDLRKSYLRNRPDGWQRAFGQSRAAEGHLRRSGVGRGNDKRDVFLFFGWFQFAEYKDGKFQFIKNPEFKNGFHAIYGYLQVDDIVDPQINDVPSWLVDHPHVQDKDTEIYRGKNNVVYTSTDSFYYKSKRINRKGSSLFTFSDELILTQKGQKRRTQWELPSIFHPENGVQLSYNPAKNWEKPNGKALFKSASKGQEFVVKTDPDGNIEQWCVDLIKNHPFAD